MNTLNDKQVADIVKNVLRCLDNAENMIPDTTGHDGVFKTPEEAIMAAKKAQEELTLMSLEQRAEIINSIREISMEHVEELGKMELEETGFGRIDNKIFKIQETIKKTPGIENIGPESFSGSYGMTLVEKYPWGVCCCILPSTAPAATVIHNSICMIAAGNSAVMCPHPKAGKTTYKTIAYMNQAIEKVGGPKNLITSFEGLSVENSNFVMKHPEIKIVLVTGGPGVVKAAFQSGKKCLCAGPGNPPVLVDGTTDAAKTAKYIFDGCSFENDLNCIGEKEVFVVESFADQLISELKKLGTYFIKDQATIDKLTKLVTNENGSVNKKYVGKDAKIILHDIGIEVCDEIKVISFEAPHDHIIVMEEYLMPILPIVRVKDAEQGIEYAVKAEGGRRHSAVVHSNNLDTITKYANETKTTVLAINGSSYNGVGMQGEGFVTMSIATATGEGLVCPRVLTRHLRRAYVNNLGQYVVKP